MASASLLSFHPHPLLISRSPIRTRARSPSLHRAPIGPFPPHRGASTVARLSPLGELPDLDALEGLARDLFGRAEGVIYTVADAAITASNADGVTAEGAKRSSDWLSGITNYMEVVLKVLKDGLSSLHVPYAYGFAIILLTVLVKAATFPLTKKQVESSMSMRSLQPQVKAIQERYAGDPEKIQMETARLYKLAGVNPLAGCLPTLATIPVWIGLYRALSNVADEGLLTEGFFWIPTLAGPTTSAARQSGSGTSWLFPFVDGHPPLGWPDTISYLVLPVLLVISQYISAQFMQPSQGNDQSQNSSQAVTKLLPLMIGYFALSVPSGLSLYWFTNNILSTAQQIWLQKLGGAKTSVNQYIDKTPLDEPSSIQNSVSSIQKSDLNIGSAKVERKQDEKVDSGGLRPGERFKQIKEQEARRKKQREEEKRKTVSNPRIKVDQEVTDPILIENIDGQVPKENQIELCMPETTNGTPNCNNGSTVKDGETQEDLEKDKVAEIRASSGKQTEALDKRDPETGRD